jgi:hypothetical protein
VYNVTHKLEKQANVLGHVALASIWRLYARYLRHEVKEGRKEEEKVDNRNRYCRKEGYRRRKAL